MLNLSDKQWGESAFFTLGISAKNISFPFANWSTVPHGRQLVVCLMESFTPRFHISCSVFPGGLNQKKKSVTHPHTLTHTEEGWLGDNSNHLWQLLNHLIFLRHYFFWSDEKLCNLGPSGDGWRQGQHQTSVRGFPAAAQKALVNVAGDEILSQRIKQSKPSEPRNGPS